ncbi:hypothetical protein RDWZM_010302 [Blomia tropicalis]|uniref:Uncharacterized protein n=1 Tax=Blomia tropicalis TaxID=40697 RepID=A0A9Q0M0Q8_BLOTA|nr:hypothetical protein RDWZM_010302 [Blomia tropicalis]
MEHLSNHQNQYQSQIQTAESSNALQYDNHRHRVDSFGDYMDKYNRYQMDNGNRSNRPLKTTSTTSTTSIGTNNNKKPITKHKKLQIVYIKVPLLNLLDNRGKLASVGTDVSTILDDHDEYESGETIGSGGGEVGAIATIDDEPIAASSTESSSVLRLAKSTTTTTTPSPPSPPPSSTTTISPKIVKQSNWSYPSNNNNNQTIRINQQPLGSSSNHLPTIVDLQKSNSISSSPPRQHIYQPEIHGSFSSIMFDHQESSQHNQYQLKDQQATESTPKKGGMGLGILPIVIQIDSKALKANQQQKQQQQQQESYNQLNQLHLHQQQIANSNNNNNNRPSMLNHAFQLLPNQFNTIETVAAWTPTAMFTENGNNKNGNDKYRSKPFNEFMYQSPSSNSIVSIQSNNNRLINNNNNNNNNVPSSSSSSSISSSLNNQYNGKYHNIPSSLNLNHGIDFDDIYYRYLSNHNVHHQSQPTNEVKQPQQQQQQQQNQLNRRPMKGKCAPSINPFRCPKSIFSRHLARHQYRRRKNRLSSLISNASSSSSSMLTNAIAGSGLLFGPPVMYGSQQHKDLLALASEPVFAVAGPPITMEQFMKQHVNNQLPVF